MDPSARAPYPSEEEPIGASSIASIAGLGLAVVMAAGLGGLGWYGYFWRAREAETAQAKALVMLMSRGAVAAYERETSCSHPGATGSETKHASLDTVLVPRRAGDTLPACIVAEGTISYAASHVVCSSSHATHGPVPRSFSDVKRAKYTPSTFPGHDFETGDYEHGWQCLKVSFTDPLLYQIHYNAGAGYVVPALAAAPSGFEAVAFGDRDGDGRKSTFALTGAPDPLTGTIKLSPLFVDDPHE